MNISRFERPVSLVPFGYLLVSRGRNPWELLYMVGNSWIPAIWLIFRLAGMGLVQAMVAFAAGYLAFIACYEIGYLANDSWDATRSSEGRQRVPFPVTPAYVALFLLVRGACWALIGFHSGWIYEPVWLAGYGTLVAAFSLHNVLRSVSLRIASFMQLSLLRFLLPAIGSLNPGSYVIAAVVGFIFYFFFRLLSYQDSKDLLRMNEPRSGAFKLAIVTIEIPFALYLSLLTRSSVIAEMLVYYLSFYAMIILGERLRRPRSPVEVQGRRLSQ